MATWWRRFLGQAAETGVAVEPKRRGPVPAAVSIQVVEPATANNGGVPRYPPVDTGIRVVMPDEVLASQRDLVNLLQRNLGVPAAEFETKYMAPIRRAAAIVNLLPATREQHHASAGGLFRFCLTMAVKAAQSAEGRIFAANEAIERRRTTESAWRHAAFLTGLSCELFRPLTMMVVLNERGDQWSPFLGSLTEWARETGSERVFVRWHKPEDVTTAANTLATWAVNAIAGNELLAALNDVKPAIVQTIFGVCSGAITPAHNSTMAALVVDVRRRVIERDQDIAPTTYGKLTTGVHLEPYFIDAMRSLVAKGVWQINTRGARLHYGKDGMFLAWRSAAQEIIGQLQQAGVNGIPSNRDTLAEMLGSAGIIQIAPDGSWIHMARGVNGGATFAAVRIAAPQSITGTLDVQPVDEHLRAAGTAKPAPVAQEEAEVRPPRAVAAAKPKPPEIPVVKAAAVAAAGPAAAQAGTTEAVPSNVPDQAAANLPPVEPPEVPAQPRTSRAAARAAAPKGAIAPVPDADTEAPALNPSVVVELGAAVSREVVAWRERWNKGVGESEFLRTPQGIGIAYSVLQRSAVQIPTLVEALQSGGNLQPQELSGRTRYVHELAFPKGPELGIVLLNSFASKAGFTL